MPAIRSAAAHSRLRRTVAVWLAYTVTILALPGSAFAAPSVGGTLARGTGNDLTASLRNNGDAPFDQLQLRLLQPGHATSNVIVMNGPPGTACNQSPNGVACQFQPGNLFAPNVTLVLGFTTSPRYPDNANADAFACIAPCSPSNSRGPFRIPGPTPAVIPGTATTLPAGFDLFETDPQNTHHNFQGPAAIPPGVICPTCGGFTGIVPFAGVPLGTFGRADSGDADTVVRRLAAGTVPDGAPSMPIPIELVALNLVSVEPITVRMQNGVEGLFEVSVELSPTRPSRGHLVVTGQGTTGGTFDSQLEVVPKYTFTPVGGGQGRSLDIGAFPPQSFGDGLSLVQRGGVWRRGCAAPALLIPRLNDFFCPGLTPRRRKRLTIEASTLARHGVYPVQPRVEHFECYGVKARRLRRRGVTLFDQFGRSKQRVLRYRELCNPARKNRERFVNKRAHLQCYALRSRRVSRLVAVRNQFGSQRLRTTRARTLCVPSRKFTRRPPRGKVTFTDHFQCYDVRRARFGRRRVALADQFGRARAQVVRAVRLCNPVQKNTKRIQHPVRHLVCYSLRDTRFRRRAVVVRNQFGRNQRVTALKRRTLCVPSVKLELN